MKRSARLIWCRICQVGYATAGEVPDHCPSCQQPAFWTTDAPYPLEPWALTDLDKLMLKTLRISST